MSGSIDLLLILPTVPPSLPPLSDDAVPPVCLSLGHLFTRLSMHPQPVGAVCPVGDFMRVGRGLPPVDRAPSRPPSPSAGDGGAAAALLGYTDRNAEQGNSILRVHLGRQR